MERTVFRFTIWAGLFTGCLLFAQTRFTVEPALFDISTSGNTAKYLELYQTPDDAFGAFRLYLDHITSQGTQFHADVDVQHEDQAQLMAEAKRGPWQGKVQFQHDAIYSHNARERFQFSQAPDALETQPMLERDDLRLSLGFLPDDGFQAELRFRRQTREGDQLLLRRGQAESIQHHLLPMRVQIRDEQSDILALTLSYPRASCGIRFTHEFENFQGTQMVEVPGYREETGVRFLEQVSTAPEFRRNLSHLAIEGKTGRLTWVGVVQHQDVDAEGTLGRLIFDPISGILRASFDEADNHNQADQVLDRATVMASMDLSDHTAMTLEAQYQDMTQDGRSTRIRTRQDGTVDLMEFSRGEVDESGFQGRVGVQWRRIPGVVLDAGAELEQRDRFRDEAVDSETGYWETLALEENANADARGFYLRADGRFASRIKTRATYRTRTVRQAFSSQSQPTTGYPGYLAALDKETAEWLLDARLEIIQPLALALSFRDRQVDYDTASSSLPGASTIDSTTYRAGVDFGHGTGILGSVFAFGSDTCANSSASSDPRAAAHDLETRGIQVSCDFFFNEQLRLFGRFLDSKTDGFTQNLGGDGVAGSVPMGFEQIDASAGLIYRASDSWRWSFSYRFVDYDGLFDADLDDFDIQMVLAQVRRMF